ncbi:MAG: Cytochrome c oxidase assembly protein CtaG / Cox11 containing protein [Haloplasmataceae bacterium]|jgi:cytochrome c oxidase assembly protein Cox11|nr:Cytochrome c oxidase assembly protein CtaG / Cox11 containing protein [Haloplasmataceae bacterium]
MYHKKINFWLIYFIIIILVQMFFFGIYNIPIYKIYCEFSNYYSLISTNTFIDTKLYLLSTLSVEEYNLYYFYNFNYIYNNILNWYYDVNSIVLFNNFYISNINFFLNFIFFYFDFFYFNFLNIIDHYYRSNQDSNNVAIIYIVYFNTSITNINLVEFISLQNHIYIYPGETYLVFFRLYNPTSFVIKGISLYLLSPYEVNIYLYKIQCFRFDELLFYPFESIELPILFYIDSNINSYLDFKWIFFFQIQIIYLFILNSFN